MQVLFFNEALMNAAKVFGVDLVNEENLQGKLGWSEMSHAILVGQALVDFAELRKRGIGIATKEKVNEPTPEDPMHGYDYNTVLLDNGVIDPAKQITPRLNVIATKTNLLIFHIDDVDQVSSIDELILNAMGEIMGMSEILESQIWSHICKQPCGHR